MRLTTFPCYIFGKKLLGTILFWSSWFGVCDKEILLWFRCVQIGFQFSDCNKSSSSGLFSAVNQNNLTWKFLYFFDLYFLSNILILRLSHKNTLFLHGFYFENITSESLIFSITFADIQNQLVMSYGELWNFRSLTWFFYLYLGNSLIVEYLRLILQTPKNIWIEFPIFIIKIISLW